MQKQGKMKKTSIKTTEVNSNGYTYKYSINQTESSRVASYRMPLYSISVKLTNGEEVTEAETKEIFSDLGKAFSFFEKLVKNLATPIDLPYRVEDEILYS